MQVEASWTWVTDGECRLELMEHIVLSNSLWMQVAASWTWVTDGKCRLELVEYVMLGSSEW
jgi:hypothetical protein